MKGYLWYYFSPVSTPSALGIAEVRIMLSVGGAQSVGGAYGLHGDFPVYSDQPSAITINFRLSTFNCRCVLGTPIVIRVADKPFFVRIIGDWG